MYRIITDIAEVERLAGEFEKRLEASFTHREQRKVNWPRGKAREIQPALVSPEVRFQRSDTSPAKAWSPNREPLKFRNFLMFGEPGNTESMNIAVQVNFPLGEFHLSNGGVFLVDEKKQIWIEHTGKMTRVTHLKRSAILRRFKDMTVMAEVDGKKPQEIIRVTKLCGRSLISDMWSFASRAREVADEAHLERESEAENTPAGRRAGVRGNGAAKAPTKREAAILGKLRKYLKEHSGRGSRKAAAAGEVDVQHGAIVDALALELGRGGLEVKNSRAVDLAVVVGRGVELFEVKTSVDTQSLYTPFGQLIIHSAALGRDENFEVRRNFVLPKRPPTPFDDIIRDEKVGCSIHLSGTYEINNLASATSRGFVVSEPRVATV